MKTTLRDFSWMAAGAVVFLVAMLVVFHFHTEQNLAQQIASKAKRVELVEKMRFALASASEAEKSAVMATTDQDSQSYADQARAATTAVEDGRKELQQLLDVNNVKNEKELLAQFSQSFTELQGIDNDLLNLAVSNTNLKASSLTFGSAADSIKGMDAALTRIIAQASSISSPDDKKVMLLASSALSAALRIQALLPPHIAEESNTKMDELEALMTKEDVDIRKNLDVLATLLKPGTDDDLKAATSSYARFAELKGQILKLSRENTNVRSLAISLSQKRKMMFVCQDALAALEQAIQAEPVAAPPMNPR